MARELNKREKEFLVVLFFKKNYNYHFPNIGDSGFLGGKGTFLINKLTSLPIIHNEDCFNNYISIPNVSILTKRKLVNSKRFRFESGYNAINTYYCLTDTGEEIANQYFNKIIKEFDSKEISILDDIKIKMQ